MADQTHVIRLHSAGASRRWVSSIGKTDEMGCTVTWSIDKARRFTPDLALRQAARLQRLLGGEATTYVAELAPSADVSTAPAPATAAA